MKGVVITPVSVSVGAVTTNLQHFYNNYFCTAIPLLDPCPQLSAAFFVHSSALNNSCIVCLCIPSLFPPPPLLFTAYFCTLHPPLSSAQLINHSPLHPSFTDCPHSRHTRYPSSLAHSTCTPCYSAYHTLLPTDQFVSLQFLDISK